MSTKQLAFVHRLHARIVPRQNVLTCIRSIKSFLVICMLQLPWTRF
jgi:hypothetical protein